MPGKGLILWDSAGIYISTSVIKTKQRVVKIKLDKVNHLSVIPVLIRYLNHLYPADHGDYQKLEKQKCLKLYGAQRSPQAINRMSKESKQLQSKL